METSCSPYWDTRRKREGKREDVINEDEIRCFAEPPDKSWTLRHNFSNFDRTHIWSKDSFLAICTNIWSPGAAALQFSWSLYRSIFNSYSFFAKFSNRKREIPFIFNITPDKNTIISGKVDKNYKITFKRKKKNLKRSTIIIILRK